MDNPKKGASTMKRSKFIPYLFIAPLLLTFIVFFLIPAVMGIYVSFTSWNLFESPRWVGFDNYYEILFNRDSTFFRQFQNGFWNTFEFVIYSVPPIIILPLFMALALNSKIKGYKFFQSIFYAPSLLSISAVVLAWQTLFLRRDGLINNFLGLDVNWFGEQPFTWMAIVIITVWWVIGPNLVIYLSALSNVSPDLLEAASIDGANSIQKFLYVTLSQIKNPLAYTVVLSTIAQFNIFGQPLMFSNGGPFDSTFVLIMYIRQLAFGMGQSQAGLASAMAVMLGLCILIISAIQYFLMTREKKV